MLESSYWKAWASGRRAICLSVFDEVVCQLWKTGVEISCSGAVGVL
jgi:hypothetical protein